MPDEPEDKPADDTGDIAAWQAHLSALTSQIEEVKTDLAQLKTQGQTGKSPEVEALQDQLKSLQIEVQEAKAELAQTREDLSQMHPSPQSVEEGNPTQEQKTDASSGQTEQSAPSPTPRQTRASKLGWL